ncbi:MAG: M28 family metallopeptidase [Defluviitaleaceae bacterium]|nr:M28 family metallopeptidase [Defluviitaleaceae bacterium]
MKKILTLIFTLLLVTPVLGNIDFEPGELAYRHLVHLDSNLPYRLAFSERELETAEWLIETLIEMGHPEQNIRMQTFERNEWMDREWIEWMFINPDFDAETQFIMRDYSQNVILTIPGRSATTIIVGAHYDSVDNAGASDNASGTALLLESAYRMLHLNNYYTIKYVFFGAEEVGLVGADYFLNSLSIRERANIALIINVDVIFDYSTLQFGAGHFNLESGTVEHSVATQRVVDIANALNAELDLELTEQEYGIFISSDSLVFTHQGFSVVAFYAVQNFHPIPPMFITRDLQTLELTKAYLGGTLDEETIEGNQIAIENMLWWISWNSHDNFEREIEWLEEFLLEPELISPWIEEELALIEAILISGILQHERIQELAEQNPRIEWSIEMLQLAYAYINETKDEKLLEQIEINMASVQHMLSWIAFLDYDSINLQIEWAKESQEEWGIDAQWLEDEIAMLEKAKIFIDHPRLEEFRPQFLGADDLIEILKAIIDDRITEELNELRENFEWEFNFNLARIYFMDDEMFSQELEFMSEFISEEEIEQLLLIRDLVHTEEISTLIAYLELENQMEDWMFGSWGSGYIMHTPNDNVAFIHENWPGLIERAFRAYTIFLEEILTSPLGSLYIHY